MYSISSLLLPVLLATSTWAHGHVMTITIAGKAFNGNVPNGPKNPSVIRQISTPDPNHFANNTALTCGPDSTPGTLSADANPGDKVTFDWKSGDLGPWPHNIGPMFTYMASCGNVTCAKFDISKAKWFKTQEVGRKANDKNGTWVQNDLMQGGVATSQIPSTLAPGNYLIRHEIIALHLADQGPGKAEFYPSCSQLRVGGNQTGVPKESDLVSIPGEYKDSDPGLDDKDVFNIDVPYVFPGPPVATLVDGQSNATTTNATTGTGSSTAAPSSTITLNSPASGATLTVFTTVTPSASAPTTTARMITVTVTVNAASVTASPSSASSAGEVSPTMQHKRASRVMRGMNRIEGDIL
ncbi:glycosyl hydrolase family 61-domain-containing protein [Pholiota molesta]|nr:glycosyl hydrolase family 61-domain-containing protein [Pholiota molesta]